MISKWDMRHYLLAMHVASWSKDPDTQVGAVIVGRDRRHLTVGYNGFPPGVQDLPERYAHRPTKYLFTQHAERNALDNASFDCTDATLATTMFPCVECAKSLIAKGVRRLVTTSPPTTLTDAAGAVIPSWRDTVPHALTMLREARVAILEVRFDAGSLLPVIREPAGD